eukprot:m.16693 g.16693  ORF g.16693 m.16693 type:complete len:422 (+) comp27070_c0_seq2:16-1281(+)
MFFLLLFLPCFHAIVDPYQDSVRYHIIWPGHGSDSPLPESPTFVVKTAEKEQYSCILPQEESKDKVDDAEDGPDPGTLLQSLFDSKSCSYRVEAYWNYELCHGNYMKQYHEDPGPQGKKGKGLGKYTQYYLGYMKKPEVAPVEAPPVEEKTIPTVHIEGRNYPYYAVEYVDGTPCDLSEDIGRKTRVLYMCHEDGRNDIILFRESSTCEYEAIVETSLLCQNAAYRVKQDPLYNIECRPVGQSPIYPRLYGEHVPIAEEPPFDDGTASEPTASTPPDASPIIRQFLEGSYCLRGGRGWWHYEFCYQQYVKQFHVGKDGQVDIYLGFWNEETHIEWFMEKSKKRKISDSYVMHYYSNGDVCDVTGKPRNVQVKLRCVEGGSSSQVSIYLEELSPCQYTLTVETVILCSLIHSVDEHGVFVVE